MLSVQAVSARALNNALLHVNRMQQRSSLNQALCALQQQGVISGGVQQADCDVALLSPAKRQQLYLNVNLNLPPASLLVM